MLCYVFSETEKFRAKVMKNNKGDFFDLTTISPADFFFLLEWLSIANHPVLGRQIPSHLLRFAQAWPCPLPRHRIVMYWDINVHVLMLQASRAWKGGPYGMRMKVPTE